MKRKTKTSLRTFTSWSRPKKIALGAGAYLAIGLVWSLAMLLSSGDGAQPGPGIGSQAASVGVTTVLWLPLVLISTVAG